MACCRYFEREQFQALCNEVAFVGPQVTQCIKLMSGEFDVVVVGLVYMYHWYFAVVFLSESIC